jgi:hypothetical protein
MHAPRIGNDVALYVMIGITTWFMLRWGKAESVDCRCRETLPKPSPRVIFFAKLSPRVIFFEAPSVGNQRANVNPLQAEANYGAKIGAGWGDGKNWKFCSATDEAESAITGRVAQGSSDLS